MEIKTYLIRYKNGRKAIYNAYSMEIEDGKVYACTKAYVGDQGVPSVWSAENIEGFDELTGRPAAIIRKMTGLSQKDFSKKYGIPRRTIESWESASEENYREAPEYVLNLLKRAVKEDYNL